jgi:hypothetical protein
LCLPILQKRCKDLVIEGVKEPTWIPEDLLNVSGTCMATQKNICSNQSKCVRCSVLHT